MGKLSMSEERLAGDRGYSLVTDDKCGNSKAKVILVSIISFVIALVIVLCVVVIKIDKRFGSIPGGPEGEPCVDIAIVGAGLSGAYTAWRLRHKHLRVSVYEMTDRTGGRLYTTSFPEVPSINLELGAPHFNSKFHPRLMELAKELQLDFHQSPYWENENNTYYLLRGKVVGFDGLGTHDIPYRLKDDEAKKTPEELIKFYMEQIVSPENRSDLMYMTTTDGRLLHQQSYLSLLRKTASPEALRFLQAVNYRHLMDVSGNAALLGHLVNKVTFTDNGSLSNESFQTAGPILTTTFFENLTWVNSSTLDSIGEYYTFAHGMSELPASLIEQFLEASLENHMHHNYKLMGFEPGDGSYNLYFNATTLEESNLKITGMKPTVCAKKIVLAIPPESMEKLQMSSVLSSEVTRTLQTQYRVPKMEVLLLYNGTLFRDNATLWQHLHTDLPLSQVTLVRPMGAEEKNSDLSNYTVIQVGIEGKDVDTLLRALDEENFCSKENPECCQNYNSSLESFLTVYLKEALNITDMPAPSKVLLHHWDENIFGTARHVWKPCVNWDSVSESIMDVASFQSVFIVGSALSPSIKQNSMESALLSVDILFDKGFL